MKDRRRANFGDKLFFAVLLPAEMTFNVAQFQTVQARRVAGAMRRFVKQGRIVFRRLPELFAQRHGNLVGVGRIIRAVLLDGFKANMFTGDIAFKNGFGPFVLVGGLDRFGRWVLRRYAVAIRNVKHVEIAQDGQTFGDGFAVCILDGLAVFVGLLLRDHLPEDDHLRLRALLDAAAFLLALVEGDIFARFAQQKLVDQGIRLAGCVADRAGRNAGPGLFPGDHALLKHGDNFFGDFAVNVFHGVGLHSQMLAALEFCLLFVIKWGQGLSRSLPLPWTGLPPMRFGRWAAFCYPFLRCLMASMAASRSSASRRISRISSRSALSNDALNSCSSTAFMPSLTSCMLSTSCNGFAGGLSPCRR